MQCDTVIKSLEKGENPGHNPELLEHIKNCPKCLAEIENFYPEYYHLFDKQSAVIQNLSRLKLQFSETIEMPNDESWRRSQKAFYHGIEKRRWRVLRPAMASVLAAMLITFIVLLDPVEMFYPKSSNMISIPSQLAAEYFLAQSKVSNEDDLLTAVQLIGENNISALMGIEDPSEVAENIASELETEELIASLDTDTQKEFLKYIEQEMQLADGSI